MKKIAVYLILFTFSIRLFSQQPAIDQSSKEINDEKKGETVIDVDGNIYRTVKIGNQIWMAENLRTTRFNNGIEIQNITADSIWVKLESCAYCWYNNDETFKNKYGALYNWFAVNTGKLCPVGWHVPSDEEWKILEGYVDSYYGVGDTIWNRERNRGFNVGQKLMASSGWHSNGNGTDDFGFSALPGGERLKRNGRFFIEGTNGFWWTSTEYNESSAMYRSLLYGVEYVFRFYHPKGFGFSVRCIMDNCKP